MIRVLVVDDEIEICDYLKNFLCDKDYRVTTALNGTEAIDKIQSENPQLLLLDIRMPGISGISILRFARWLRPDLKIIMITAVDSPDMIRVAKELGADDYITKPFSLNYLEKNLAGKVAKFKLAS